MSDERLEQIQGMLPTAPPAEQDAARLELLDEVDLQRHVAKRRLETIRDLDQTLDRAVDIRDRSEEIPLIRLLITVSGGPNPRGRRRRRHAELVAWQQRRKAVILKSAPFSAEDAVRLAVMASATVGEGPR